jgi:hypothetical protein
MSRVNRPICTLARLEKLAREIEPLALSHGFHVGIAGGCLHKGNSYHDMDLIVFPHNTNQTSAWKQEDFLADLGLKLDCSFKHRDHTQTTGDNKLVYWARLPDRRRVDIFFLQ